MQHTATDVLVWEHDEIVWQLRQLRHAQEADDVVPQRQLRDRLDRKIAIHVEIEQEVPYPFLAQLAAEAADQAANGLAVQEDLTRSVLRCGVVLVENPDFAGAVDDLEQVFDESSGYEEDELFPVIFGHVFKENLNFLGRLLVSIRRNCREECSASRLMACALAADSNCIDIGCHRGSELREIIRRAPRGQHIAFERLPDLAAGLHSTFPSDQVRCAAASDMDDLDTFVHITTLPVCSGLRQRSSRTDRLDSVLEDGSFKISSRSTSRGPRVSSSIVRWRLFSLIGRS